MLSPGTDGDEQTLTQSHLGYTGVQRDAKTDGFPVCDKRRHSLNGQCTAFSDFNMCFGFRRFHDTLQAEISHIASKNDMRDLCSQGVSMT